MTPIDELAEWAINHLIIWGMHTCFVDGEFMHCAWAHDKRHTVVVSADHQEAARLLLNKVREA